jgi:hypothetical protein
MARKKKPKKFSATKAAKFAARAVIGAPRPTLRHATPKEQKRPKHKPTLTRLLNDGE